MSWELLAATLATKGLDSFLGGRQASQQKREQSREDAFQNLLGSLSKGNIAGNRQAPLVRPSLAQRVTGPTSDVLMQKLLEKLLGGIGKP